MAGLSGVPTLQQGFKNIIAEKAGKQTSKPNTNDGEASLAAPRTCVQYEKNAQGKPVLDEFGHAKCTTYAPQDDQAPSISLWNALSNALDSIW